MEKWKLPEGLGFGVWGLASMERKVEIIRRFRFWRVGFSKHGKENGNY